MRIPDGVRGVRVHLIAIVRSVVVIPQDKCDCSAREYDLKNGGDIGKMDKHNHKHTKYTHCRYANLSHHQRRTDQRVRVG